MTTHGPAPKLGPASAQTQTSWCPCTTAARKLASCLPLRARGTSPCSCALRTRLGTARTWWSTLGTACDMSSSSSGRQIPCRGQSRVWPPQRCVQTPDRTFCTSGVTPASRIPYAVCEPALCCALLGPKSQYSTAGIWKLPGGERWLTLQAQCPEQICQVACRQHFRVVC